MNKPNNNVVTSLTCPTCRANIARLQGWVAQFAIDSHECPACARAPLTEGSTILYGRERATGTCGCCQATWLADDPSGGWTCLERGRLL